MTTDTAPARKSVSGLGLTTGRGAPSDGEGANKPIVDLDPATYDRALACVHCGLCLPACPTYTQNGLEADSPRGRIYLMKGLADGKIEPTESVVEHLDLCLDCRACETACPSGVVYHELIEATREQLAGKRKRSLVDRFVEWVFYHVFPFPKRLKWAMWPARMIQKVGLWPTVVRSPLLRRALPEQINKMRDMLPPKGPMRVKNLREHYPAYKEGCVDGKPRATVALLTGCVGSVLFQHVNRQSVRLLQLAGCDVVVPRSQVCCGAIHHHGGRHKDAAGFARSNVDAFLDVTHREPDYIVNNIAGCGAMLKEYGHLLADDADHGPRAERLSERSRDIMQLLVELDLPRPKHRMERKVTYHDACHLAHAQKVVDAPRRLLQSIDGLELVPLRESDMCCGAAGTYNLAQPEMARDLAERKIKHIQSTGCRTCVTGNVGCAMQIQSEADRLGVELHVTHPVSLLYEAYFGDDPPPR